MDIKEHIESIKQYFIAFNMDAETAYLITKFPQNWKIIDEEFLNTTYKVYTKIIDKNTYFVTDVENGSDCLFNAANEVISTNKDIEEKAILLKQKCKELSDLFLSEPIEKLRTITFTFTETKRRKSNKNSVKIENENNTKSNMKETVENEETETILVEKQEPIKPSKKTKDSKNMEFLKNIVNK